MSSRDETDPKSSYDVNKVDKIGASDPGKGTTTRREASADKVRYIESHFANFLEKLCIFEENFGFLAQKWHYFGILYG